MRESIMTYFFYSGFRVQGSGFRVQWVQRGAVRRIQTGSAVNVYGAMPKGLLTAGFPHIVSLPQWGR